MKRPENENHEFTDDEELYRRFHPDALDGGELDIDSIQMPDMSVNRAKYSVPGDVIDDEGFEGWGVAAFRVFDIPPEMIDQGVDTWTFLPVYDPRRFNRRMNYAHTEVRGYLNGVHFQDEFPPEIHLRFRNRLRLRLVIRVMPA